jgi:hypothetical protein
MAKEPDKTASVITIDHWIMDQPTAVYYVPPVVDEVSDKKDRLDKLIKPR